MAIDYYSEFNMQMEDKWTLRPKSKRFSFPDEYHLNTRPHILPIDQQPEPIYTCNEVNRAVKAPAQIHQVPKRPTRSLRQNFPLLRSCGD